MKNYYRILEISPSASEGQIKSAFKRLAVKYHPDKHKGDAEMEELFKIVNEAYQVLSDPYKKAQYDLQLHYRQFSGSAQQNSKPAYQRPKSYRPPTPPPRFNTKENAKSTLYAFGLTFLVALFAVAIMGLHKLYVQNKYNKLLEERRVTFEKARGLYQTDEISQSLTLLADLSPFKPEEKDMKKFRTDKLEEIIFKGESAYSGNDFRMAIRYYELVEEFSPYRPNALKARLAQSYRYDHQPDKSLRVFVQLIEDNYQVIPTLVQMAEVYQHEMNDLESARDYLELARESAADGYERRFGKGYPIFISQEFIPIEHFYLFKQLGTVYNLVDQPHKSIGATNWMKRIWPDSAASFVIAGESYEIQNLRTKACEEYQIAKNLGHQEALPLFCQ